MINDNIKQSTRGWQKGSLYQPGDGELIEWRVGKLAIIGATCRLDGVKPLSEPLLEYG